MFDPAKYHAIVDTAVEALTDSGKPTALAALIESGDRTYSGIDWDNWSEEEHKVYGMLWGLRLCNDGLSAHEIKQTPVWKVAVVLLGHEKSVLDIAKQVWEKFE